jgi:hypothetical protein
MQYLDNFAIMFRSYGFLCNMLQGEVDELRTALEQAERARKNAENELYEASDRVNELSSEVSSLQGQKRKLEADIQAMQVITNFECIFFFHSKNTFLTPVQGLFSIHQLLLEACCSVFLPCCMIHEPPHVGVVHPQSVIAFPVNR